jgi:hypothetical protein
VSTHFVDLAPGRDFVLVQVEDLKRDLSVDAEGQLVGIGFSNGKAVHGDLLMYGAFAGYS